MILKRINNILIIITLFLGLYIIVNPLLPNILFAFRDTTPEVIAPYSGQLAEIVGSSTTTEIPTDNRLVIPTIGIDEAILESNNIGVIDNGGTWRRPNTSSPSKGSNTVIVGHRFYGLNGSTFYNLDKLKINDSIAIYWEGKEYLYSVTDVKVVSPSAVEIEAPTADAQLTLYTCTPLWTAKDRLVITAKPIEINSQ